MRARFAQVVSALVLGTGVWLACVHLDRWAARGFARRELASTLCGALELGILAGALCLAPALSALIARMGGARRPPAGERRDVRPGRR